MVVGYIEPALQPGVISDIPDFDVLCAGFPCQPFSKSGHQLGVSETRGTLFFHIETLLRAKKPKLVVLENVRNLAGPRHRDTWQTVIDTLRDIGYRVSSVPTIFSPHWLPPRNGGAPQVRERVFIFGTFVGTKRAMQDRLVGPTATRGPVFNWDPNNWDIYEHITLDLPSADLKRYDLSSKEHSWLDIWEDFLQTFLTENPFERLPG